MQNANVTFERDNEGVLVTIAVNKMFTTAGNGLWSTVAKDVFVNDITMYVVYDNEENCDGDMGINYSEMTWDNYKDGLIYTDKAFIAQVREYLIEQGFDKKAVNDITYSEQGMQSDGRVSCDAYDFADSIRKLYITVTA